MPTTIQSILESYEDNVVALALHELIPNYPEGTRFFESSSDAEEYDAYIDGLDQAKKLIDDGDYLSLTDTEADDLWDTRLDDYIDECILPEIPDDLQSYFDRASWKRDASISDGRGYAISSYDGEENEQEYKGTTYYIYRIN